MKNRITSQEALKMQKIAGIITEGQYRKLKQTLKEGVKLDALMKDGKPNPEVLVVPAKFYKDEAELRANVMRPAEVSKEEGDDQKIIFNVVGGSGGKKSYYADNGEIADIKLFADAQKEIKEGSRISEDEGGEAGKPEIGAEILYISSSMGKQKAKVIKYGKNYDGEDTVILQFPDKNNQRLEVDATTIKKEPSGWVAR